MPPPHLHPRSRMTSSLFATTVLASFLVVALPHILPCPAPRRRAYYADDGGADGVSPHAESPGVIRRRVRRRVRASQKRECPVPKPGGILGEWLGFHGGSSAAAGNERGEKTRPDR
ncbi:hypothetical protein N658DRAFT_421573 [Parathielavia hyrcaniae]|uniref:Uncharacterized protein n=1 Tax=Parathielavia hyrcaniae TaxID=113614 RepID=A0AAN6T499_9PEZI|nr:hypothetical protein N658DRAFT_421573 [Parathielavia hyrcaniae]